MYSKALRKKVAKKFIQLFQSYQFKEHLCFAYVANLQHFYHEAGDAKGIHSLGVQILTMDSITSRILQDRVLCLNLSSVLHAALEDLLGQADQLNQKLYMCFYLAHDFKYIAKPGIMPQLIGQTVIIDQMLEAMSLFHLKDVQVMPTAM